MPNIHCPLITSSNRWSSKYYWTFRMKRIFLESNKSGRSSITNKFNLEEKKKSYVHFHKLRKSKLMGGRFFLWLIKFLDAEFTSSLIPFLSSSLKYSHPRAARVLSRLQHCLASPLSCPFFLDSNNFSISCFGQRGKERGTSDWRQCQSNALTRST